MATKCWLCQCTPTELSSLNCSVMIRSESVLLRDMLDMFIGVKEILPDEDVLETWMMCGSCIETLISAYDLKTRVTETLLTPQPLPTDTTTADPEIFLSEPLVIETAETAEADICDTVFMVNEENVIADGISLEIISTESEYAGHISEEEEQPVNDAAQKDTADDEGQYCELCDDTIESKKRFTYHKQFHFPGVCMWCSMGFATDAEMIAHIKEVHVTRQYVCMCCGDLHSNRNQLRTHMRQKHDMRVYVFVCGYCDKLRRFAAESHCTLRDHMWDVHNLKAEIDNNDHKSLRTGSTYICPKCPKRCVGHNNLLHHLAHGHNEKCLTCGECGHSFNRQTEFDIHMAEHRLVSQGLDEDDPTYLEAGETSRPYRTETVKGKTLLGGKLKMDDQTCFACEICNMKFTRKVFLRRHVCAFKKEATGLDLQIKCTHCDDVFGKTYDMFAHRKATHLRQDVAILTQCVLCDKNFKTWRGLKYHLTTHTGMKPFTCPYCAEKFIAKGNLIHHLRQVHAESKDLSCEACDQKFSSRVAMDKHVLVYHSDGPKFQCKQCDRKYFHKCHYLEHLRVGHGKVSFECQHCGLHYKNKSSLNRHFRLRHEMVID